MNYKYIYKENFTSEIYETFHNFFNEKANKLLEEIEKTDPKRDFEEIDHGLRYGLEGWVDDTFDEAIEATRYSIECEEVANEMYNDFLSDFDIIEEEIKYHNERAKELQYNER